MGKSRMQKMVNFSDNQSTFPDGLMAAHTEAGKIQDAPYSEG
jgi:hypothetical protein